MEYEDLVNMRNTFREAADVIDELLVLESRENKGEDVTKELESAMGRFMIKMMQLKGEGA